MKTAVRRISRGGLGDPAAGADPRAVGHGGWRAGSLGRAAIAEAGRDQHRAAPPTCAIAPAASSRTVARRLELGVDERSGPVEEPAPGIDCRGGQTRVEPCSRNDGAAGELQPQRRPRKRRLKLAELDPPQPSDQRTQAGQLQLGQGGAAQAGTADLRAGNVSSRPARRWRPASDNCRAAIAPAGPAPITIASQMVPSQIKEPRQPRPRSSTTPRQEEPAGPVTREFHAIQARRARQLAHFGQREGRRRPRLAHRGGRSATGQKIGSRPRPAHIRSDPARDR